MLLLTLAVFVATTAEAAEPHTVYPEPPLPSGWVTQFSEVTGGDVVSKVSVRMHSGPLTGR